MTRSGEKSFSVIAALRWLRGVLGVTAAIVIIVAAVVVGIGRLLLPWADELRPWLEQRLSEELGQPVTIERVEAHWPRLTPSLALTGIAVGAPDRQPLEVERARLEMHLPDLFRASRNVFNLVVLGLDVRLVEDRRGDWGLELVDGGRLAGEADERDLLPAGDLVVRDARLRVHPRRLPALDWRLDEGVIQRSGEQSVVRGRLRPAGSDRGTIDLRLLLDHPGAHLNRARAWLGIEDAVPAQWLGRDWPGAAWLAERRLAADVWLAWSEEDGVRGELDFSLQAPAAPTLAGSARLAADGDRQQLDLVRLESDGRRVAEGLSAGRSGEYRAVAADYVDLEALHSLAEPWLGGPRWWPRSMAGEIRALELGLDDDWRLHRAGGEIISVGVALEQPDLAVSRLDLELSLAGDRLALTPSGQPRLDWPGLMRSRIEPEAVGGRVIASREAIELAGVGMTHAAGRAQAEGWIWLTGERPFLDFHIDVQDVTGDPRPWLPHGEIPERAMDWLDRALVHTDRASGGALLHLRAGRRARDLKSGDFQAWIDFAGADLDYGPGWPMAREMNGAVRFIGKRLTGRAESARVGEVELAVDELVIDDLTAPQMHLELAGAGLDAGQVDAVVGALPATVWQRSSEVMDWHGELDLDLAVNLPFRRAEDWRLRGRIGLHSVGMRLPAAGLALPPLAGTVPFTRTTLGPAELVQAGNGPDRSLEVEARFRPLPRLTVSADLAPAEMFAPAGRWQAVVASLVGSAEWHLDLHALETGGLEWRVDSDLRGLELNLPAPLAKSAAAPWPSSARGRLDMTGLNLALRLGPDLDIALRRDDRGHRLGIGAGGSPSLLPAEPGFRIDGRIDELDLSGWRRLLAESRTPAGAMAGSGHATVQIDRVLLDRHSLEQVSLELARRDESWQLTLDGPAVAGAITVPIPLDAGPVLAVDLERLHLTDHQPPHLLRSLEASPVGEQTSSRDPVGLPPLHLLIEDFRAGSLELGRVRIESYPGGEGVEVERIDVSGGMLEFNGRGRWYRSPTGPYSEFNGRLMSSQLNRLLAAAGYESGIEAAHAQVELGGRWPGAPFDFSLARMSGDMALRVVDGSIPEARPGAGRLIGLISLSALPRRLILDFRDVFGQGLKFDRIEGGFELVDGFATTDGLDIRSPAARIRVTGTTDMSHQTYDQEITVEPVLGATLPVLGGLAGGPAGAAAGLVLRTLLDRPLRDMSEVRYRVSGSWAEPEIELIEARPREQAPPAPVDGND